MQKGTKLDNGKPLLGDMIYSFREVLVELCKVFQFGVNKYGFDNWKSVENGEQRFKNALMRHFLSDKEFDEETGLSQNSHIAYNALMILWFELQRRKKYDKR